ncbi:TPA: hypothetical protein VA828_000129 [Streptococcus agalactiae]|nr:hypothetical protein [Streptococcus agalactiae]
MNHQTQTLSLEHFVSLEELSNQEVMSLIKRSIEVKENPSNIGFDKDYYVSNLFFENSTRTHKSFEMAELKLGLKTIEFNADTSSVNKGETLYDTILTMSALGLDVCVIMHPAPVNRDVEIASDLVEADKARIVKQMSNGVYARIAILEAVLNSR